MEEAKEAREKSNGAEAEDTEGSSSEEEGAKALKVKKEETTDGQRLSAFIDILNEVYWKLYVRKPSSPLVIPVVDPGRKHVQYMYMYADHW